MPSVIYISKLFCKKNRCRFELWGWVKGPKIKPVYIQAKHSSLRCRKLELQVGTCCLQYPSKVHSYLLYTNNRCISLRTLQPFCSECCSPKRRAVMKMRLFPGMDEKFWLSLNIFTLQSPLRISRRDTRADNGSSAANVFAHQRLFSFERTGKPHLSWSKNVFCSNDAKVIYFLSSAVGTICSSLVPRSGQSPPDSPYLPLLKIKEWIWINNFLTACQEMMCEKSRFSQLNG